MFTKPTMHPTYAPQSRLAYSLALILFLQSLSSLTYAQDVIASQLAEVGYILAQDGYKLTNDVFYSELNHDEYNFFNVYLEGGWQYKIVAACDEDCGDMDLVLYDAYGYKVDFDDSDDDLPYVSVSPRSSGKYRLKVIMYDCEWEPCEFGVGVFGR